MKVTWFQGGSISRSNEFYPVPKRIILAKARDWKYNSFSSKFEYSVHLLKNNSSVVADLESACICLNWIYRHAYHSDWCSFSREFSGYQFFATPERSTNNLLIIPSRKISMGKDIAVLINRGTPDASIYVVMHKELGIVYLDYSSRVPYDAHYSASGLNKFIQSIH